MALFVPNQALRVADVSDNAPRVPIGANRNDRWTFKSLATLDRTRYRLARSMIARTMINGRKNSTGEIDDSFYVRTCLNCTILEFDHLLRILVG